MADRYWVGSIGSQSWANTANWSTSLGGSGGASVPATGDNVYIVQGRSQITQGLSQSAVELALLHIGFQGSIGTSTTPLEIGLAASGGSLDEVLRIWGNDVSVYIAPTMTGTFPMVQVFGNSGQVTFSDGTLKGFFYFGNAGLVTIASACASSGFSVATMGASVVIQNMGATDLNGIAVYGGVVECDNATASSVSVFAGRATFTGSSTHASISVYGEGVCDYRSSGTITNAQAYGGEFTASNASLPFTVTSSLQFVNGALFPSPPVTITYTNPTVKYGFA